MNTVIELCETVKRDRWCTNIPCTTCGALEFRRCLEQIGAEQVITELGMLEFNEFYDHSEVMRSIFKWLRHEWALFDPSDLDSIKDTPAYDYFYSHYHERKQAQIKSDENRIREEARQAEFRKVRAEKASHDLVNAVVRGDIKAVQGLLSKGGDPDFNRGNGTSTAREIARLWGRENYFVSEIDGE